MLLKDKEVKIEKLRINSCSESMYEKFTDQIEFDVGFYQVIYSLDTLSRLKLNMNLLSKSRSNVD